MAFVTVSLADADGNFVPMASDTLSFDVTGSADYQAACNGDATSLTPFVSKSMELFSGKLVVLVRSSKQRGEARLKVDDARLGLSASISFDVK